MSEKMTLDQLPLASALGTLALIGVNDSKDLQRIKPSPFLTLQRFVSVDLNTLQESGLYYFTTTCPNSPTDVNAAGALMLVWSHAAGYVSQLLLSLIWDVGGIYYRHMRAGGEWRAWRKFNWTMA